METSERLPFAALFIATVIYGLTNILLRLTGSENYFSVIFFVLLLSTVMLLPVLKASKGVREVRSARNLQLIVLLGFFVAATWFLIYYAIMNTSVANAVFGYMTTPVFVIVLSPILLKENLSRTVAAALVLALVGILLVFDPRNLVRGIASIGVVSGVLAGFASAMLEIIGRRLRDRYSPASLTFLGTLVAMLFVLPVFVVTDFVVPDTAGLVIIVLLGLGGAVGGTLLYYGLRHIYAQSVSVILLLEPFVSIVAAYAIFVEVPSVLTVLGAVLLVVADAVIIKNQG